MDQLKEHIQPIKLPIKKNKNFIYKGKTYPIDFSLIIEYSIFFYDKKNEFESVDDIELHPYNNQLSEDSVSAFISCCQNKPFDITDSNIFDLHQLSIQYRVSELNKLTTQYMEKNKKSLIFQLICYKLQNQKLDLKIDLNDEEKLLPQIFLTL